MLETGPMTFGDAPANGNHGNCQLIISFPRVDFGGSGMAVLRREKALPFRQMPPLGRHLACVRLFNSHSEPGRLAFYSISQMRQRLSEEQIASSIG